MLLPALVAVGASAGAPASTWTATSGSFSVTVDTESFAYNVFNGTDAWLLDGTVAVQCGGRRFDGAALVGGPVTVAHGTDAFGTYEVASRNWSTIPRCTSLTTEIRWYGDGDGDGEGEGEGGDGQRWIDFVTIVGAEGANGTATESALTTTGCRPITEFPSLILPNMPAPTPPPPTPAPGPPALVGCSDGTCEALCEHASVRGCGASWSGTRDLRASATGKACGSDAECAAPADACGPGWALCLSHTGTGRDALDTPAFLRAMSAETCANSTIRGAFVAAMSHAPTGAKTCPTPANQSLDNGCPAQRGYGSEPLCCGDACGVPSCSSALWPGQTRALFGTEHGAGSCGAVASSAASDPRGVLCCKVPSPIAPTPTPRPPHVSDVPRASPGFLAWDGDALHGMYLYEPQPGDFTRWNGGLNAGPLVLHATDSSNATAAAVLGPSTAFKTAILSRVDNRVVGGVQGMITALPPLHEVRFALVGRGDGVTSAMLAYGSKLRRGHASRAAAAKLRLAADPLSRQLHYVTDGGSLLNYCDYWPQCTKTTPPSCVPQGETLRAAAAYHRAIGLNVSVYHVDPYWWSREPLGGCSEGPYAINMSASPWHFPDGLLPLGIEMMLFVQAFQPNNIYADANGGGYAWAGQSVAGRDSARFWGDRFREFTAAPSTCSALTLDGLEGVWRSSAIRYNTTGEQQLYDDGLADAAFDFGLPIRVDQAAAGDVLASVRYGARTVQRCTYDADPVSRMDAHDDPRWQQLGGNALLLRAVGLRPFTDVVWTTVAQSDPRWGNAFRPHVLHDVVSATLSAGPVGFGDLINGTNASLLAPATRSDGTILKPAATALRVDRFYRPPPAGGAEIWAAPAGPAGGATDADDRANAMAQLGEAGAGGAGGADGADAVWWWSVLATNVDGHSEAGQPLALRELWPAPAPDAQLLVATLASTGAGTTVGCTHGTTAASCGLKLWAEGKPIDVGTSGDTGRNFTALAAAPVLGSGWVLLGDLRKYVPCSPQRFVAPSRDPARAAAPREADFTSTSGAELEFDVIGSQDEVVPVTLIAPTSTDNVLEGTVVVVTVTIGEQRSAAVSCAAGRCTVH